MHYGRCAKPFGTLLLLLLLMLMLAACGGGGGGDAAPPPATALVGPAGGTVTGPSGSKLVIPPGALASDVRIDIEQTSAGAPALPGGLAPSGAMFAFTPHGTNFAIPVAVTLPFDPSSVPVGAAPAFYKTNAQSQWEQVANATFSGNTVVAQISSFSFGQVVVPPLTRFAPHWEWEFKAFPGIGRPPVLLPDPDGHGSQDGGLLGKFVDFGKAFFDRPFLLPPNGGQAEDGRANGLVAASEDGVTFGAFTEAPNDGLFHLTNIGSSAKLVQRQSFKKNAADASLTFTLSHAEIEATDFHNIDGNHGDLPEPQRTRYLITGQLEYAITAFKGSSTFFSAEAVAHMDGNGSIWTPNASNVGSARNPLWSLQDFDFSTTPIIYSLGNAACLGTGASMKLKAPRTVTIDLRSINTQEEFTVQVTTLVTALNRRGGGRIEECNIASVSAFLKDPQQVNGTTMTFAGLEPTNRPLPPPPEQPLVPPASCPTPNPTAGVLQFEAPAFAIGEFAGAPPVIKVTRTGGSSGEVSATFTTSDGTAIGGVDYTPVNATVFFADGDTAPRFITVPTIQNEVIAPDKTVNLALSQPGGCATLGTQSTAVLTIVDETGVPVPTYTVGGTVNGLASSGLVLREALGGGSVTSGNGTFVFPVARLSGSGYDVRVDAQPTNPIQICSVANGVGTVANANVTNVVVTCSTPLPNGALDPSFGNAGKVASNIAFVTSAFNARMGMALQADGRILLVGAQKLARFNGDGTLDTGFGTAGVVTVPFNGSPDDMAQGVAVQTDGRIVVVGTMSVGGTTADKQDFALARFNTDGTLDTGFGTGGIVTTDFNGSQDIARRIVIQPDGKLLVAGYSTFVAPTLTENQFALARYNVDGSPDTSFATGLGRTTTGFGGTFNRVQGLTLQRDGKIVVAGVTALNGGTSNQNVGVARYLGANTLINGHIVGSGSQDPDFNDPDLSGTLTGGQISSGLNRGGGEAVDVVEHPGIDGQLLVAVNVGKFALATFINFTDTGTGKVYGGYFPAGPPPQLPTLVDFSGKTDQVSAMALQADGKVLMVGRSDIYGANPDMAIARFVPGSQGASIDTTFGNAGKVTVDFFGAFDLAEAVAVQPDGKIVVGGYARNAGTTVFALVRLMP